MKLTSFLGIIMGLFVLGCILFPFTACGCKVASKKTACLSNLKQQAQAVLLYSAEENDRFPNRDVWMDSIAPYVKNQAIHKEPTMPAQVYGYAFNSNLSDAKGPRHPEKVPLVYDSVNPIRNASDAAVSLPSPGRHAGKDNIAYADGHVKAVNLGESPK